MASRISRNEQKKEVQQAVIFVALAVGIIGLFIFVVLPFSIRMFDSVVRKGGTSSQSGDTIPPQIPILNSLPNATNSAQLVVSGSGEADAKTQLYQNGGIVSETTADGQGSFVFTDIPFQDGENVLYVVSTDTDENSSESQKFTVVLDTTPPSITVDQPADGSNVTDRRSQLATVKGTTDKGARVYLNDKLLFTDGAGGFSGTFQLQQGDNTLTLRVTDQAGNTVEKQLKVTYNP